MKKNCWEYKNCGKQPGGKLAARLGACSASVETKLDGVHGGKNAGRACWVIGGTLCGGQRQEDFGRKFQNCMKCEFYHYVKDEEGSDFVLTPNLLRMLREK